MYSYGWNRGSYFQPIYPQLGPYVQRASSYAVVQQPARPVLQKGFFPYGSYTLSARVSYVAQQKVAIKQPEPQQPLAIKTPPVLRAVPEAANSSGVNGLDNPFTLALSPIAPHSSKPSASASLEVGRYKDTNLDVVFTSSQSSEKMLLARVYNKASGQSFEVEGSKIKLRYLDKKSSSFGNFLNDLTYSTQIKKIKSFSEKRPLFKLEFSTEGELSIVWSDRISAAMTREKTQPMTPSPTDVRAIRVTPVSPPTPQPYDREKYNFSTPKPGPQVTLATSKTLVGTVQDPEWKVSFHIQEEEIVAKVYKGSSSDCTEITADKINVCSLTTHGDNEKVITGNLSDYSKAYLTDWLKRCGDNHELYFLDFSQIEEGTLEVVTDMRETEERFGTSPDFKSTITRR